MQANGVLRGTDAAVGIELASSCAGCGAGTLMGGRLNLDGRLHPGGGAVWGAGAQQQASARMATASSVLGATASLLSAPPAATMTRELGLTSRCAPD